MEINLPTSISNAIYIATPGSTIKLSNGTYEISTSLNLKENITLEGGFLKDNNWKKTSFTGSTIIKRIAINYDGDSNNKRLVAIYGNSIENL